MKTTLTLRLDARQAKAVADAARASGQTISDVVRSAIDQALTPRTIAARAGHAQGRLRLSQRPTAPWKKDLRERNWRP